MLRSRIVCIGWYYFGPDASGGSSAENKRNQPKRARNADKEQAEAAQAKVSAPTACSARRDVVVLYAAGAQHALFLSFNGLERRKFSQSKR